MLPDTNTDQTWITEVSPIIGIDLEAVKTPAQILADYEEVQFQISLLKSDMEALRREVLAPVAEALLHIEAEYGPMLEAAQQHAEELAGEVKEAVVAQGKTQKGAMFQAVYMKGRESWDGKKLEGYAAVHPEVLNFRTTAAPTVQIRTVK